MAGTLLLASCANGSGQAQPTTLPQAPTVSTSADNTLPPTTSLSAPVNSSSTTTTTTTELLSPLQGLALELVADGFDRPLFVASPPLDSRLFVVERTGRIRQVGEEEAFLDLTDRVGSSGIEQGLLGLAFHPAFAENGRFFVYYTDPSNDSHLVEFQSGDSGPVDTSTARTVLSFEQPTDRHNAGMLQFGPDGYLYVALGEGGNASEHSQDPSTLLSAILRLDIDGGDPYAIPPDNPFASGGGAPEVWAFGLRNPWRFDIDSVDQMVYIADVGHSDWEEINVVPLQSAGYNFGWVTMEGSHCFSSESCDTSGLVMPVLEYSHSEGCSITGGFVYRGAAIPELTGHYFYSDWCGGFIRSFRHADGTITDQQDWTESMGGSMGQVNSFGTDSSGEIYTAMWDGAVYRIVPIR